MRRKMFFGLALPAVGLMVLFAYLPTNASTPVREVIIDDPPPGGGGGGGGSSDCTLLTDPNTAGMLSVGLEQRLKVQCGVSASPVGSGDPGTFAPAQFITDRMVNNSASDLGPSTTQSETVVAVRTTDGRLCAGWNDSQHYANSPFNS